MLRKFRSSAITRPSRSGSNGVGIMWTTHSSCALKIAEPMTPGMWLRPISALLILAPPARSGSQLQVARLRLAPGSLGPSPWLAGSKNLPRRLRDLLHHRLGALGGTAHHADETALVVHVECALRVREAEIAQPAQPEQLRRLLQRHLAH